MPSSILNSDDGVISGTAGLKNSGGDDAVLLIQTKGVTAQTVDAGQRTMFPTTIGVGGATPSTSGSGISFPATQSASTNANTLDDYEEGGWTPTVNNMTTTGTPAYGGTYRKIGSQVTIWFFTTTGGGVATYTAVAGSTSVAGLPFTSSFGGAPQAGGEPGVYTNGSTTAGGFLQGPGGGTGFFFSSSMSSSQGVTASLTYVTT